MMMASGPTTGFGIERCFEVGVPNPESRKMKSELVGERALLWPSKSDEHPPANVAYRVDGGSAVGTTSTSERHFCFRQAGKFHGPPWKAAIGMRAGGIMNRLVVPGIFAVLEWWWLGFQLENSARRMNQIRNWFPYYNLTSLLLYHAVEIALAF